VIEIKVKMEFKDFDEVRERLLVYGLATFLGISPALVKVKSVKEGSVKVALALPSAFARKLLRAYNNGDTELSLYLSPFHVESLDIIFEAVTEVEAVGVGEEQQTRVPATTREGRVSPRICDKCGRNKDVCGGKTCSKGHFICNDCAGSYAHCPLCGYTMN